MTLVDQVKPMTYTYIFIHKSKSYANNIKNFMMIFLCASFVESLSRKVILKAFEKRADLYIPLYLCYFINKFKIIHWFSYYCISKWICEIFSFASSAFSTVWKSFFFCFVLENDVWEYNEIWACVPCFLYPFLLRTPIKYDFRHSRMERIVFGRAEEKKKTESKMDPKRKNPFTCQEFHSSSSFFFSFKALLFEHSIFLFLTHACYRFNDWNVCVFYSQSQWKLYAFVTEKKRKKERKEKKSHWMKRKTDNKRMKMHWRIFPTRIRNRNPEKKKKKQKEEKEKTNERR